MSSMAVNSLAFSSFKAINFLVILSFYFIKVMNSLDPQLRDFFLFCVERRGKEWPYLYDEMTMVAGQRLFRGLNYTELKELGLSLSLNSLDETIEMVAQAIAQDPQA